jgi:hypothetical protein
MEPLSYEPGQGERETWNFYWYHAQSIVSFPPVGTEWEKGAGTGIGDRMKNTNALSLLGQSPTAELGAEGVLYSWLHASRLGFLSC